MQEIGKDGKMYGLTDEENEEYIKLCNLASRAHSFAVIESCDLRIRALNNKSRLALKKDGFID